MVATHWIGALLASFVSRASASWHYPEAIASMFAGWDHIVDTHNSLVFKQDRHQSHFSLLQGTSAMQSWGEQRTFADDISANGKQAQVMSFLQSDGVHGSIIKVLADDEVLSSLGGALLQSWGKSHATVAQVPADGMVRNLQGLRSFGTPHGDVGDVPVDSSIAFSRDDFVLQSWGTPHTEVVEIPVDSMAHDVQSLQQWGEHASFKIELDQTSLLQTGSDEVDENVPLGAELMPEVIAEETEPVLMVIGKLRICFALGACVMLLAGIVFQALHNDPLGERLRRRGRRCQRKHIGVLMQCSDRGF